MDYDRKVSRLDCVVKISYRNLFGDQFSTYQGVRIFVRELSAESDTNTITLTFLDEINPDHPDFTIFGEPLTSAVALAPK